MSLTYDALFPGRFIKAGEMDGKPVTLTIKDVYVDKIEGEDGREKPQAVVSLRETGREWALNRTNGICLRALFGDRVDDWIGKKVTVYPERDTSGLSDSGVCIRVLGSPHLDKPLTIEVKLPRRKPLKRTLKPTGKNGSNGHHADTDTGEVFADDAEEAGKPAHVAADDAPVPSGDTEPPGMDYDEYVASHAPDDGEASNVLPLVQPDGPVTAAQLAAIKTARKVLRMDASAFASLADQYGDATQDGYGLTVASADLLIEELKAGAQP